MSAQPIQAPQAPPRPADAALAPEHPTRAAGGLLRSLRASGIDNAYDCVHAWALGCCYHRCPTWGEVRAELPQLIQGYGLTRFDVAFMSNQILPFL